jgi:hypothetical protein
MKAELVKRQDRWDLYGEDGSKIASSAPNPMGKLSLKNCEAIANGYDLDELSSKKYPIENTGAMFMPNRIEVTNIYRQEGFIEGAKAILEILGDKKFSEHQLKEAIAESWNSCEDNEDNETFTQVFKRIMQSLQQTEWDVEIVNKDTGLGARINRKPKLDAENCLILKRI